ncbi:MAG: hypothetical protein QOI24_602 [Acidobacteriota bacterium]|jgi:hypothetical protein|nr:hypothetical protein [Acidobacteriota bacterium]
MSSVVTISTILDNLIAGAVKYVGEDAAGWVLNGVLGTGGPTGSDLSGILATLDSVEQGVANLQTTFGNFVELYDADQKLAPAQNVCIAAGYSNTPSISGDFHTLSELSADDTATATTLSNNASAQSGNLNAINNVMCGPIEGMTTDLMTAAANVQLAQLTSSGINTSDPAPLMTAYENLEGLFDAMFQVQVQGLTLTMNGYNALDENDLAVKESVQFMANLATECGLFLSAVQSLAAGYHSDVTLMDMLIGGPTVDPIRAAQIYLNGLTISLPPVPRVWIWSGSGDGFNLSAPVPLPASLTLGSEGAGGDVTADAVPVSAFANSPWTVARYEYPSPMSGLWGTETPAANVLVASGTSTGMPYDCGDGDFEISFDVTPGGNDGYIVLASIASLETAQDGGCLLLPQNGVSSTTEVWFFPNADGTLFSCSSLAGGSDPAVWWAVGYESQGNIQVGRITLYIAYEGYTDSARTNLVDHDWNHVAVAIDQYSINIYVNGLLVMGPGSLGYFDYPNIANNYAANTFGASFFNPSDYDPINTGMGGAFNELRVWNRALTAEEIYDNMYQALTSGDGLVAAYGFDRGNIVARVGPPVGHGGSFTYPPLPEPGGWTTPPYVQHPTGNPPA